MYFKKFYSQYILIFLIFSYKFNLYSQDNFPAGARSSGLANSGVVLVDLWANMHNQACLSYIDKLTFGYHYENKYIDEALSLQALAIAIPAFKSVIGGNVTLFGDKNYYESKFGLSVAKIIFKNFSAAVQLDLLTVHQSYQYDNLSTLAVEMGLFYNLNEKLYAGIHIYNITNSKYKEIFYTRIPFITEIGIAARPMKKLFLIIETEINSNQKTIFKGGLEYNIIPPIFTRIGISSYRYSNYSFGVGFNQKHIKADIAFSQHVCLGFTPHLSFTYSF